jgi:polysaccharide pyruvyl transferase WcaK-like protein
MTNQELPSFSSNTLGQAAGHADAGSMHSDTAYPLQAQACADPVVASKEALQRYALAAAPDEAFLADMQQRIDAAASLAGAGRRAAPSRPRRADDPLRVLLISYSGTGNTGADLRTIETIAQIKDVFALRAPRIKLVALGTMLDHPVLARVTKLDSPLSYLPDALDAAVREADLVLNVEGSTYTSKFSDSLAGSLIGGVALAHAHGCVAVAYGVDSGAMSAPLQGFVRRNAGRGLVICRNGAARAQLAQLGVRAERGADTAWRWRAKPSRHAGADGERVVALCPNNPFWWPVYADAARARALDAAGEASPLRYGELHFHRWDEARERAYDAYLTRFAELGGTLFERGYTPVIVGMEQLDETACRDLAERMPCESRIVVRGGADLETVATTVAHAHCVVTTRYHAAVVALSHGVPAFGLSMDERIDRLLDEAGLGGWYARCDADDAGARALDRIGTLDDAQERARIVAACERYAEGQRSLLAQMGQRLADRVEAIQFG